MYWLVRAQLVGSDRITPTTPPNTLARQQWNPHYTKRERTSPLTIAIESLKKQVIMAKLYGVSFYHHPCHHLCHHLCWWAIVCVIISCDWWSLLPWMYYCWRLDRIKSIVVNGWWRGMTWHGMLDCYIWLCWYIRRNRLACWMMMNCRPPCWICVHVRFHLLFQLYMYSRVMLLIALYDDFMLVQITWNTDDSVTTIRDDDVMSLSVLYVRCDA